MEIVEKKFKMLKNKNSDINQHLETLKNYAKKCDTVIELGVRGCISSWAFLLGLLENQSDKDKKIILNDIKECNIADFLNATKDLNITVECVWKNDLELDIEENVDLTFIDTWHVYGQLKRELNKFSRVTNKYIIMHDTQVDRVLGETVRNGWNAKKQSEETGIPVEEINMGLGKAIKEFLENNSDWKTKEVFKNNNGLTILERIN